MIIYLFGNPDYEPDSLVFVVADKLKSSFPKIKFERVKPNEDLPFVDQSKVVLMDVVMGLKKPNLIKQSDLDKVQLPPRFSAHDFDLGFQLKYLQKLGKLKEIFIIGLPMNEKVDYKQLEKIIKKLKA